MIFNLFYVQYKTKSITRGSVIFKTFEQKCSAKQVYIETSIKYSGYFIRNI